MTRRKLLKRLLWLGIAYLLLDAFWLEKFFIAIRRYDLPKRDGTPGVPIRLVQISDLHLQSVGPALRRLATRLNQLQPDLICFTGDSVDKATNLYLLDQFLALLDARSAKVAILGNWEYWGRVDLAQLRDTYAHHDCRLLVNEFMTLEINGKTLGITGLDDFIGGQADYAAAERRYELVDFHLVLNHCPAYRDEIGRLQKQPIDLVLSGHTHGGQINLLGWAPFRPPGSGRYVGGWYRDGDGPPMYVSKGVGTSVLPVRVGVRAEVGMFQFWV